MTNWLILDNDIFRIPEITHAWLIKANIHYWSFDKLIEGLSYLENFKAPVVEGFCPTKVVKTSVLSSSANSSSGCSFRFVKYPPCLQTT